MIRRNYTLEIKSASEMTYSYTTGWFVLSYMPLVLLTFSVYILRSYATVFVTGNIPLNLFGKWPPIFENHIKSINSFYWHNRETFDIKQQVAVVIIAFLLKGLSWFVSISVAVSRRFCSFFISLQDPEIRPKVNISNNALCYLKPSIPLGTHRCHEITYCLHFLPRRLRH